MLVYSHVSLPEDISILNGNYTSTIIGDHKPVFFTFIDVDDFPLMVN